MDDAKQSKLATEWSDDRYRDLDLWSNRRLIDEIVDSNERAVAAVRRAAPQLEEVAEALVANLQAGGRIIYVGAGTSGRIALQDAAELPPTFGFDRAVVLLAGGAKAGERAQEGAEDDEAAARREVANAEIGAGDTVLAIAASGRTPFTVAATVAARESGATTVGIANNPDTPLLREAQIQVLLETGPEVLAGSTRLAAGTAQKIVVNALTTAALVRLGGAYGNLMVGMTLSNNKLRRRGVTMIRAATGADESAAAMALEAAGGSVRVAIVSVEAGVDVETAREALHRSGHRVRDALRLLGVS